MGNEALLEQRLEAIEHAVADLQHRLPVAPPPSDWVERATGSVTDASALREAMALAKAHFAAEDRAGEAEEPS